jgi:hypothetical protein
MKTDEEKANEKALAKRVTRYAALIGLVLAMLCNLLPPDHRALCQTIVALCTP